MIVIDASIAIELILQTQVGSRVSTRVFASGETRHAPQLIDLEVAQVLRRFVARREIDAKRGRVALEDLGRLALHRYDHDALLPRVWTLRDNLTAYDAAYVALAEALGAPMFTRDRRLAAAPGLRAKIEVF